MSVALLTTAATCVQMFLATALVLTFVLREPGPGEPPLPKLICTCPEELIDIQVPKYWPPTSSVARSERAESAPSLLIQRAMVKGKWRDPRFASISTYPPGVKWSPLPIFPGILE